MPSIRKRLNGLMRTLSTQSSGEECAMSSPIKQLSPSPPPENHSFIYLYLTGRLKKGSQPEIYCGKTGVDLPLLLIDALDPSLVTSYTGPDLGCNAVPALRRHVNGLANLANLDDELSLGTDADSLCSEPRGLCASAICNTSMMSLVSDSGECAHEFDWTHDHPQASGYSTSLYEVHPVTGQVAGTPIADVHAVIHRQNNCILALADGVNWGEGARLAARCAVRGAIDHLTCALYASNVRKTPRNTQDIFHHLLAAFHTGHQLILQQGGLLTTLCVAVVVPLCNSSQFVVCACNVGDSLCFVYNRQSGVREVTLGSHDIHNMRDMRDAGGALGPVDGINPELQNLTCSMTVVDPDDIVFITSDGVSDNFDPVVGKFCVIKEESPSVTHNHGLPVVQAHQRHELMLLRMEDLLRNGVTVGDEHISNARHLCTQLVNFAHQLTMAKRRILEDPELYQSQLSPTHKTIDQRTRRRMVRQRISEVPGKLDHATVVAYQVTQPQNNIVLDVAVTPTPINYYSDRQVGEVMQSLDDIITVHDMHEPQSDTAFTTDDLMAIDASTDSHTTCMCVPTEALSIDECDDHSEHVTHHSDYDQQSLPETEQVLDLCLQAQSTNYHIVHSVPLKGHCAAHKSLPVLTPQPSVSVAPVASVPSVSAGVKGRLTRTINRIENTLTKKKKHRRGSPHRHTTPVEPGWFNKLKGTLQPHKSNNAGTLPRGSDNSHSFTATMLSPRLFRKKRPALVTCEETVDVTCDLSPAVCVRESTSDNELVRWHSVQVTIAHL